MLQVKDPALSLQQLGSLLWRGFDAWPRNGHMTWAQPKKKGRKEGRKKGRRGDVGLLCR